MGSRERGRLGALLGTAPGGPVTSDVQKGCPRSEEEEEEVGGHPGLLSLLLPLPTAYLIISTSALLLPLTGLPAYPTWGGGHPLTGAPDDLSHCFLGQKIWIQSSRAPVRARPRPSS